MALGIAAAAILLATGGNEGQSSLAALEGDPDAVTVADRLQPGDTHVRTIRKFQRYGPIAEQVMADERAGPDTQIVQTAASFDTDGCLANIETTRSDQEGNIVEIVSVSPGDANWHHAGEICIEQFRESRRSLLDNLKDLPEAYLGSESDEFIEIVVQVDLPGVTSNPQPGNAHGGYRLPYTDDLDVVDASSSYFLRSDTLELAAYEVRAHLADGSAVVLIRWDVLTDEVITAADA
jgi:hypothetical protein